MGRRWVALALAGAALTLDVAACFTFAGALGVRNDFFPRWLATRLWLTEGQDLYSTATNEAIGAAMGPLPLPGDASVFGFVYPAYVAFVLAPLARLPYRGAATIWLLIVQLSVMGGTLLAWRACERERGWARVTPLPAVFVAGVLPATLMSFLFLQFSGLTLLGLAASWWLAVVGHEARAGVALLLTGLKPQLGLLPGLALLARGVRNGQRRLLATAGLSTGALGLASLVVFPGWPGRFRESAEVYAGAARPASAASLLGETVGGAPWLGGLLGVCVAMVVTLNWWRSSQRAGETLGAAVLLSVWLVPPLYEWNNLVLLLVLVPALRRLRERGGAAVCWLGCAALVGLSAGSLLAISLRPSESRVIWPVVSLAVYLAAPFLGNQRLTSSAPAPSAAART
jgi:hypothetical protein